MCFLNTALISAKVSAGNTCPMGPHGRKENYDENHSVHIGHKYIGPFPIYLINIDGTKDEKGIEYTKKSMYFLFIYFCDRMNLRH